MGKIKYIQIINRAVDYIHRNLDKNLKAEEIADYCCFSRFYFSRIFKGIMNESVYSFIKRRKLENATFLLIAKKNMPITEIALRNGYSSSNFASLFKEYYGISATEYRKKNEIPTKESYREVVDYLNSLKKKKDSFDIIDKKIIIKKINKMNLLYERFIGNYNDLVGFWDNFCKKANEKQLINENTHFIGVSYDDPLIVDENRCIYDACIEVEQICSPNVHKIEEGYYACYEYHDKLENIAKAYNEIFSFWMPFCGYDIDNRLPLEIYYSVLDEEGRARFDICIPIIKEI